jgi:hypothetical protein
MEMSIIIEGFTAMSTEQANFLLPEGSKVNL